jgi:hypothetical protein
VSKNGDASAPPPAERSPPTRPLCDVYGFDETRVVVARSPETTAESDGNDDGSVASYARPLMGESDPDYGPTRTSGDHGAAEAIRSAPLGRRRPPEGWAGLSTPPSPPSLPPKPVPPVPPTC